MGAWAESEFTAAGLGSARRIAGDDRGALEAYERKLQLDPAARLVREAVEAIRKRLAK